jgi:Cu/Ag efflux protein CusF
MPHKILSIVLLAFALCACKEKAAKPVSHAPIEKYNLDGMVVSVDPKGHIAKINGQKIEGWMDAMTMDYPINDEAALESLHAGDHITATVFVQDLSFWLGDVHHVR